MDWTIPLIVLQLIFLEGILSIDNAAVLGAMVAPLPNHKPVPWPRSLRKIGQALHPLLGDERSAALRVGLLGAYLGRGLMLVIASFIVQNPWLKLIGALYLVRLAFDNLGIKGGAAEHEHHHKVKSTSFWGVVLTVELMDLVFSLDNVVAAVALSDRLWVVMLGVAIGIVMMRFAASWFSYAVEREPVLKSTAYILVFNIGIELLVSEFTGHEINDWLRFGISIGTILLSLAYSHSPFLKRFYPALHWVGVGFARLNAVIDWVLMPLMALVRLPFQGIRLVFFPRKEPSASQGD